MRMTLLGSLLWLCAVATPGAGLAQDVPPAGSGQAILVFLDCNGPECDFDHFRREITWVNWVRDREDADLHLLITAQETGGGGSHYTLDYLGRRAFEGTEKSRPYVTDPTDTDAEVRDGLTRSIALGLVQFVETTPFAASLRVVYDAPAVELPRMEDDPWNLWVFELQADGSVEGESQQRSYSIEGSASADRVSEETKINFELSAEYERDEFDDLEEGQTFISTSGEYAGRLSMVWSINDQWSAGARVALTRSTFLNQDLALATGPVIEYNIFPYSESTRRSLTFRYAVEMAAFNYELETVEGRTQEVQPRHSLQISADVQQPWGEIFGSIEGIQYFRDPATHRINTFLSLEYRLFRGFGLDIFTSFSRIKDQFFLPVEELSEEEILLRRRQRETDFRFDVGIGFSYRFGSKFANIVNPRISDDDGN